MYLRKLRPRGRGKKQIYWELVESYRTAKGSRQASDGAAGPAGLGNTQPDQTIPIGGRHDGRTLKCSGNSRTKTAPAPAPGLFLFRKCVTWARIAPRWNFRTLFITLTQLALAALSNPA